MQWLVTSAQDGNLAAHTGDDPVAVRLRRALLSDRIGKPIQWMDQVHGDVVEVVDDRRGPSVPCDALVTFTPGIAVGVLVADCMPLLLLAHDGVGAVHVGRRGLANGIALKAIRRMREQGCEAISAVIGPSICGLCYEVPQEMHDEMVALWPAASARTSVGTPALDLRAGLEQQLLSAGVEVRHDDRCTRESVDLYSHRRDGGPGRFAAVVWR